MQKHFLVVLALVSAMGFAMPALAAPKILSNTQTAPPIPLAALPIDARNAPQQRMTELVCGDITYRFYEIRTVLTETTIAGYDVATATKGSATKRFIQKFTRGNTPGAGWTDASTLSAPFACTPGGIYAGVITSNSAQGSYAGHMIYVPYAKFSEASSWDLSRGITHASIIGWSILIAPETADGIVQMPGTLVITESGIHGDSRPGTIDANGRVTLHTLPWYRDLNQVHVQGADQLGANFYRLSDGYGVVEYSFIAGVSQIKYYRIHNGEASYSQVDSLPIIPIVNACNSCILPSVGRTMYGATLYSQGREYALLKRLPTRVNSGTDPYSTSQNSIKETDTTFTIDYWIRNDLTNQVQYWQAVVQK